MVLMICVIFTGCGGSGGDSGKENPPSQSFNIGGDFSGLTSGQQVTLLNNGGDALTLTANGPFNFKTPVAYNGAFNVTVGTQPKGETCTVVNGSGAGAGIVANVSSVKIICSALTYSIGGSLAGLTNGQQVTLLNNGSDALTLTANGPFTFKTPVAYNGSFNITVGTQPKGETCTVANGSGAGAGIVANVSSVQIICSALTYSIGGSLAGLTNGQQVTLLNNGSDALTLTANGPFTFKTPVAYNGSFNITVGTQPKGETCTVANGTGAGAGIVANVSSIQITCSALTYSIGGSLAGLTDGQQVTLLNNGGDALTLTANGPFTFQTQAAYNGSFNITIGTQPTGRICSVKSGMGTNVDTNITNVSVSCPPPYTGGVQALQGGTIYPRVVRLEHGSVAVSGMLVASTNGIIFQSTDGGDHWEWVSKVPALSGTSEYCCGTLYELPKTIGKLNSGTLLFAGTYFSGSARLIEIWTSIDEGKTWSYHSTPVQGGDGSHGLWEPEFEVASDGALVMFWSDETDSCCSQKLAQIRSYDGQQWQDRTDTVHSLIASDRPGMATVSQLPNGHFFMSYELCGPAACAVFSRTSLDGWDFGDPHNMGVKVQSTTGQYLEHAPLNRWSPSNLSSNGAILLVGQVMYESNGSISSSNGRLLFVNSNVDGSGLWSVIPAPVSIPNAYDNFCPNYSSALLPGPDGKSILELASNYDSSGACVTYYAGEKWE